MTNRRIDWVPTADVIEHANVTQFAIERGFRNYSALWEWSIRDRVGFWDAVVDRLGIKFETRYTQTLDVIPGIESARWFLGGRLNIVASCFQAPDHAPAVIHKRGAALHRVSYGELRRAVEVVARAFEPGESVAIAMPMTIEAVISYLAVIHAGGRVVSVADSFASPQIEARLKVAPVTTVITQDRVLRAGRELPMVEKVWEATSARCVVVRTERGLDLELRDHDLEWDEFFDRCQNSAPRAIETGAPERHSNVLFSSGTTGEPKAIPWSHTTPIKAAMDSHFHQDVHAGDVVCWPTNLGWMMGPWVIYASLINGATMALYDDAPTSRAFGAFVQGAGVTMLGVIPSIVSTWRSTECMLDVDWSAVRTLSSTGEVSRPDDMRFLSELAGKKPVIEYCGGTEIGGGYITSTVTHPWTASAFTTPALGINVSIVGDEVDDGSGHLAQEGELFLHAPSVGMSTELLNADHSAVYYDDVPYPGLRRHGDRFRKARDGSFTALGRNDDAMNLGGIKVSSAEVEAVARRVSGVGDVAAVGVPEPGGGPDRLVVFVVSAADLRVEAGSLREAIQDELKRRMNPLFKVYLVEVVDELPRTASGKVMRRELRGGLG